MLNRFERNIQVYLYASPIISWDGRCSENSFHERQGSFYSAKSILLLLIALLHMPLGHQQQWYSSRRAYRPGGHHQDHRLGILSWNQVTATLRFHLREPGLQRVVGTKIRVSGYQYNNNLNNDRLASLTLQSDPKKHQKPLFSLKRHDVRSPTFRDRLWWTEISAKLTPKFSAFDKNSSTNNNFIYT